MYVELIIIFNIYIDFIVILMTSILLKRKLKFKKLITYASLLGISSIILFFRITILELIIISFLISLILIKKLFNSCKALFYFYFNSIMLGGFIFLINNYFKLNAKSNFILITFVLPIVYFIYKIKIKDLKENYNLNYEVEFINNDQNYRLKSFLDTGNNLVDPYFNKPVILINNLDLKCDKYFYIPYSTISESGIMKAFLLDNLEIIGVKNVKNVIVGILPNKLKLKKIDCLLNTKILEE